METKELSQKLALALEPLGYEIIALEVERRLLRVFIDHTSPGRPPIGVGDCAKASKTLDAILDTLPELEALIHGSYELEVSSPGLQRPLKKEKDFERFLGKKAKIQVLRPLSAEESENPEYQKKNPKQKTYLGTLKEVRNEKIILNLHDNKGIVILIPFALMTKANLEPEFETLKGK